MEHVEYTFTVGMDDAEVRSILEDHDTGVLSLADAGRAYGLPVHYHFGAVGANGDGEGSLYLRLIDDEHSKKMAFLESTEEASFLLYGVSDDDAESWSVVATGTLRRLTGEERAAFDDAEINEDFGAMRIFGEDLADVDVAIYEFVVDSLTGRRTPAPER